MSREKCFWCLNAHHKQTEDRLTLHHTLAVLQEFIISHYMVIIMNEVEGMRTFHRLKHSNKFTRNSRTFSPLKERS